MAGGRMTEYERRRLENIRRNNEMLAALSIRRTATDLSAAAAKKRYSSFPKRSPAKKPKPAVASAPVVLRRSLRNRGIAPDRSPSFSASPPSSPSHAASVTSPLTDAGLSTPASKRGPLSTSDALVSSSDSDLMASILSASPATRPIGVFGSGDRWDPWQSLELRPENIAKLVPERIMSICFFPFEDRTVIAAGDKTGHVGFWDLGKGDGGVYLYSPHSAPVSGISLHPFSRTKMFTGSYDGYIRLMDVEDETFNMIYTSDYWIQSICQKPDDCNSLFFGERYGELKTWDERAGKLTLSLDLHETRINTIDFNPENVNIMATSSTDKEACLWDLRYMDEEKPKCIKAFKHSKAVHSAYFSPSGKCFATTSLDNTVGIFSGVNYDDQFFVEHYNQTGRWLSNFRAIWGWDDYYLYIGNMERALDVICTDEKSTVHVESEHLTSIPCRFAAHPCMEATLAAGNAGGKVFLWTKGP